MVLKVELIAYLTQVASYGEREKRVHTKFDEV
jgi:hypothetical protein